MIVTIEDQCQSALDFILIPFAVRFFDIIARSNVCDSLALFLIEC